MDFVDRHYPNASAAELRALAHRCSRYAQILAGDEAATKLVELADKLAARADELERTPWRRTRSKDGSSRS
jgi:hypothetical protein